MHTSPLSLRRRADALRLSNAELARRAGMDKHTVGRVLSGTRDALASSVAAIAAVIETEEAALRAHLTGAGDGAAAARAAARAAE